MTKTAKITAFLAVAALSTCCITDNGQAAPKRAVAAPEQLVGREPWPTQRTIVLLPLQFGPGWNLDRTKAPQLLPIAEQKLQQALQRTGKFSTTQVHRYNPIFLRRIKDRPLTAEEKLRTPGEEEVLLTKENYEALLANPTVEGVQTALSSLRFDQAPLIAQFSMEEVTTQFGTPSPIVMTQVTGQLFEYNNPVAIKTVVVTSDPVPLYIPRKVGKKNLMVRRSASDRILVAADNAFVQIAREFVKPVDDIILPEPVAAPAVVGAPVGATRVPPAIIQVPPGQVLGSFPATR